jgi:hypothetical protein
VTRIAPLLAAVCVALLLASTGAAARPFQTGLLDPSLFASPDAGLAFTRVAGAGASVVRLQLIWAYTAPKTRPAGFDPADPGDPAYDFSVLDTEVDQAVEHGLTPLVYVQTAPDWGRTKSFGFVRPDPQAFGDFAHAAAARYSGAFEGHPRVRFWQAWNEPNKLPGPAWKASQPDWYRALLDRFAASVHAVQADNVVVAGGLAPFGGRTVDAPLVFMRRLLCIQPACAEKASFEVWSTHPYTSGGPVHKAFHPGDVSLGDLPAMHALLLAGVRAHRIVARQPVRFWVTEFSWDSSPPDPGGLPAALEARWVSEALYRMWSAGVTLCVWYRLDDEPYPRGAYQSGLYYRARTLAAERPKPALQAFRFPFVAFPNGAGVTVWGRTPASTALRVTIEQHTTRWVPLGTVAADANGIFSGTLRPHGTGPVRARLADGTSSLGFALTSPPDRFVNPFGR